jgi:hypothetical protein
MTNDQNPKGQRRLRRPSLQQTPRIQNMNTKKEDDSELNDEELSAALALHARAYYDVPPEDYAEVTAAVQAVTAGFPPGSPAWMKAAKKIKWVMTDMDGRFAALEEKPPFRCYLTANLKDMLVCDGRDSEPVKLFYYGLQLRGRLGGARLVAVPIEKL